MIRSGPKKVVEKIAVSESNFVYVEIFETAEEFWGLCTEVDCRCAKSRFAQSTAVCQLGKMGKSDEDEDEKEPEMGWSKKRLY